MTQLAYSIETLAAFFPAPSPPKMPSRGGQLLSGGSKFFRPPSLSLRSLIENPAGIDRSADTLRFAGEAAREGWSAEEMNAALLDPGNPISAHCLSQPDPGRAADRVIEKAMADLPPTEAIVISPTPYVWVPPEQIRPLDWIMGHWVLRDEATFVVAPGGIGKTTFLAAAALSLVTGRSLLGKDVRGGAKRVWIWNLEDSVAMMTRSIQAAAKLHGIAPGEIGDRLFLDTSRDGAPLCTTHRTRDGLEIHQPVHLALVEALLARKIDVLIVDPFVSSHEGNENDNGEMDRVLKNWCKVAQEASCAVILCHHTSKAGSAEVNTNSARGAVAMTAAARVVLVLNAMTKGDGDSLGVDLEDRWRLVQVTMDKSNRAPLEKGDWFRKTSVPLGLLGKGDNAGAIEPWSPPKAVELLTPEAIIAIRKAFGDEPRRAADQSPEWAGYIIAEALGLDVPENRTPSRGKVRGIIKELINQGHLLTASGKDPRSKIVPMLRLA